MFLKSLEIFGFKSFADRTRLEFSDGITSLLGPNGSGKSNIVDAIKWVLGTQSLKSLRAGKREDVIFNGTDNRKPLQMCEVTLTIDNEQGFLAVQEAEVEIKRRLYRTGESEFYINREKSLLKDVKDLFLDTGVGKTAYSILEQGKIDRILSTKPEDRRYVFEEAAGISRFKVQAAEAEKKLEKTDENLVLVDAQFQEIRKTYESRKTQVDKLIKQRELTKEKERLEIDLQLYSVQNFRKLLEYRQKELATSSAKLKELEQDLQNYSSSLKDSKFKLDEMKNERQVLLVNIHGYKEKIHGIDNELSMLDNRFAEAKERRIHAEETAKRYQEKVEREKETLLGKIGALEEMHVTATETEDLIVKKQQEIELLSEKKIKNSLDIDEINEKINNLEINQHEVIQQISGIANEIVEQLDENINSSGYSAQIRRNAEKTFFNYVNDVRDKLISITNCKVDDLIEEILSSLDEIKGLFQEYSGTIPTFLDEFISADGTITKKRTLDSKLHEMRKSIDIYRNDIENLQNDTNQIENSLENNKNEIGELNLKKREITFKINSLKENIQELQFSLSQREFEFSDASQSVKNEEANIEEIVESINDAETRKKNVVTIMEDSKVNLSELSRNITELETKISTQNTLFVDRENEIQEKKLDIAKLTEGIKGLEEQIAKVFSDFFANYQKSLKEFDDHEVEGSIDDIREKLALAKKRAENLGYINYMAEEEFDEAKSSYDFIGGNLEDLKKARKDLEEVISKIKTQSEELFLDSYKKISYNFEKMFSTLFSGGKAELKLDNPDDPLNCGIEILAQPPGKKLNPLSLLSGGERSMTAVGLLFATYMVKPSPFCILDEIDAALDDRNIGAFLEVLTGFAQNSQFIIITHNKHTVMGSKTLLGVTQQEPGVSITIGYKIDSIEELPVIFDEDKE